MNQPTAKPEFKPVMIPTDPKTGYEMIVPGRLYAPPHFILKRMHKKKNFKPRNRLIRFFWVFFQEGF